MAINLRQRISNYYKRWNIDTRVARQTDVARFQNRIIASINSVLRKIVLQEEFIRSYAFIGGFHDDSIHNQFTIFFDTSKSVVCQTIEAATSIPDIIYALQVIFWALEKREIDSTDFYEAIKETIEVSTFVDVCIVKRGNIVTLYPSGVKLLDDNVVNDTLGWLDNYPAVSKHFEKALQLYLSNDVGQYRHLLDDLRCAMEQLLRSVLNNRKPIEKQKDSLGQWLEKQGIHTEVREMYSCLLTHFSKYQNDAVKHDEAWAPPEVEFMIYLTGTFMRLLLQLNQETANE
ncbi:MAG: hypothetical protein ACYDBB_19790 [Armatimonadota bacterium]